MDYRISQIPPLISLLEAKCEDIGFTMPSDQHIGSFLRTLIRSKPSGRFLELGTGIGLSLAWMVDGLSYDASLISIDNDPDLIVIARAFFSGVANLDLVCEDGSKWIKSYQDDKFDLIFADAWPGKYSELEETLALLKKGGCYIIDDMNVQANWPADHEDNVDQLVKDLEKRTDLTLTKFNWSTGIIMAVKK